MFKLSDASGKMTFSTVAQGKLDKSVLDSKDVFLVDGGKHLYVWVGSGEFFSPPHPSFALYRSYTVLY